MATQTSITKILKPVFGYSRHQVTPTAFVDDSYMQGDTKQEFMDNMNALLSRLRLYTSRKISLNTNGKNRVSWVLNRLKKCENFINQQKG